MRSGSFPRLVIAAASSGTGKTTVASGLMAAFRRRGLIVQPFKAGPDYIDPGFHTLAAGREGRNLDTRLMPRSAVTELFRRAAEDADISLIEGVMGLYDGAGPLDERGSTAHLAKMLKAPVAILLDVKSMARSAGALALGFCAFDRRVPVAGFILNRIGSPNHLRIARTAVERATGLPVFGGIPADETLRLPERHLGLVPAWEASGEEDARLAAIADRMETSLDLDALLDAARRAPEPPKGGSGIFGPGFTPDKTPGKRPVRIALALDDAFHFYYPDNLDILKRFGAELVPFSPLKDRELPPDIGGIYFGGGYPELHGKALEANSDMRRAVREAAERGLPILGECGGLMYLSSGIADFAGNFHRMAGVLPARVIMEKKLFALGYFEGELAADCFFGKKGESCMGHVFHWSRLEPEPPSKTGPGGEPLFILRKPERNPEPDGFAVRNVAASYLHIHFAAKPRWAKGFVEACRRRLRPGGKGEKS